MSLKEDLETMSFDDIAYVILKEKGKKIKIILVLKSCFCRSFTFIPETNKTHTIVKVHLAKAATSYYTAPNGGGTE